MVTSQTAMSDRAKWPVWVWRRSGGRHAPDATEQAEELMMAKLWLYDPGKGDTLQIRDADTENTVVGRIERVVTTTYWLTVVGRIERVVTTTYWLKAEVNGRHVGRAFTTAEAARGYLAEAIRLADEEPT